MSRRDIWLLGPQYHSPILKELVPSFGLPEGPIAVVTAGWQEREGEDEELDKHLGGRSVDLRLYHRADHVFRSDPDLMRAHREMQRMLRDLESLYNLRLTGLKDAVMKLQQEKGDMRLVKPEREHAMRQLRELDAWHLKRIVGIRGEFEDRWRPSKRESVASERVELARLLEGAVALVITGGHVAVLLNRLRLFGVKDLVDGKPIIAWSAGAMVLTERVVVFHDHPPQGAGNAEVLEEGLGLCPGIVALPDGRKRLDLRDPDRISTFAARFRPANCIVMGEGDCISFDGRRFKAEKGAMRLGVSGELEKMSSW